MPIPDRTRSPQCDPHHLADVQVVRTLETLEIISIPRMIDADMSVCMYPCAIGGLTAGKLRVEPIK